MHFTSHCNNRDPPNYIVCIIKVGVGIAWYICLHTVQCTLYSVQCTVYTVQCTMYNIHCTVYNVQYTLYTVRLASSAALLVFCVAQTTPL